MLLGVPFRFTSLGNIEINSASPTRYEYRFRSTGGTITGVRVFLIFRAAGYFAGNGGQIKVELTTDGGSPLSSYTDTNPMGGGGGAKWPLYPLSAVLSAGTFYRFRFSNPGGSPSANWVSVDDLYCNGGPTQPGWAELGIQAYQGGSINANHTPCFTAYYSNGSKHSGAAYQDVPSAYIANNSGSITFTPSSNLEVSEVFLGLGSGSGTVSVTLKQGVTTIDSNTASAHAGWVTVPLSVSLTAGVTYTLQVTGTFQMRGLQKGLDKGFGDPFLGGSGHDTRSSNIDLPIYFSAAGGSPPPPVGSPPGLVVSPVISGQAVQGATLNTTNGTWSGTGISYTYKWRRCNSGGGACVDIGGATSSSYVIQAADVGSTIRSQVTATNADGSASTASTQTGIVAGPTGVPGASPVNVSLPTISGFAGGPNVGEVMHAGPGSWDGNTPMTFAYQWRRCNAAGGACVDIAGATGSSYVLDAGDVGSTIRVEVTASN